MPAKMSLLSIEIDSVDTGPAAIFELACAAPALAVAASRMGSENTHETAMAAARNTSTALGALGRVCSFLLFMG